MGLDSDLGDGLGADGRGLGSGTADGSALEGTFYDLKLTRSGAKSKLYPADEGGSVTNRVLLAEIWSSFIRSWSPGVLERSYKSPTKLYASNFYLPQCDARYGPLAYQCDPKKNKPAGWVAVP